MYLSLYLVLSSLSFLLLPSAGIQEPPANSLKEEAFKMVALIQNKKYISLHIYYLLPSFAIAFYTGFLYKLVGNSLPQGEDEPDDDYNQRVSFSDGLVFIALGVSQVFNAVLMNRFS